MLGTCHKDAPEPPTFETASAEDIYESWKYQVYKGLNVSRSVRYAAVIPYVCKAIDQTRSQGYTLLGRRPMLSFAGQMVLASAFEQSRTAKGSYTYLHRPTGHWLIGTATTREQDRIGQASCVRITHSSRQGELFQGGVAVIRARGHVP